MEYVKLGNTGLDVSRICLGCMSFGTAEGWVHNQWALDAVESLSVQLTPEDVAYLEEPYVPHPIVGLIPYGGQLLSARR